MILLLCELFVWIPMGIFWVVNDFILGVFLYEVFEGFTWVD